MSYEAARFECREPGCKARFLTANARNGHEQTHEDSFAQEVIRGP